MNFLKKIDIKGILAKTAGGTAGVLASKYAYNNLLNKLDDNYKPFALAGVGVLAEMMGASQKGMVKSFLDSAALGVLSMAGELSVQTFAPELYAKIVPVLPESETPSTNGIGFNPGVIIPDQRQPDVMGNDDEDFLRDPETGKYYKIDQFGKLIEVQPDMSGMGMTNKERTDSTL